MGGQNDPDPASRALLLLVQLGLPDRQLLSLQHVVLVELDGVERVRDHVPVLVVAQDQLALHALQDRFSHDLGRAPLGLEPFLVLHGLHDPARDQLLHGSVGVPREVVLGTGNSASNLRVPLPESPSLWVAADLVPTLARRLRIRLSDRVIRLLGFRLGPLFLLPLVELLFETLDCGFGLPIGCRGGSSSSFLSAARSCWINLAALSTPTAPQAICSFLGIPRTSVSWRFGSIRTA